MYKTTTCLVARRVCIRFRCGIIKITSDIDLESTKAYAIQIKRTTKHMFLLFLFSSFLRYHFTFCFTFSRPLNQKRIERRSNLVICAIDSTRQIIVAQISWVFRKLQTESMYIGGSTHWTSTESREWVKKVLREANTSQLLVFSICLVSIVLAAAVCFICATEFDFRLMF